MNHCRAAWLPYFMVLRIFFCFCLVAALTGVITSAQPHHFVSVKGHTFFLDGKAYYFVGANYWYGGLLGLEKDKIAGMAITVTRKPPAGGEPRPETM